MRTRQKRQVCILLPNKQHLDCTVRVRARGHEVLNSVLKHLGVSELQVFGLAVLRDNEYLFLESAQKLSKYFGKRWNRASSTAPFILFLRVQYYVESGLLILSSKVQQLYYTELRQKVLHSQSCHQEALLFQLAASALQAEVGDLEQRAERNNEEEEERGEEKRQERKHRHYFLPEDYFPSWLIKRRGRDFLLQHCPVLHVELRGVTRSQAVLQFIKEASSLQDGPVTFYRMRQEKKELRSSILLGVAMKGVHIYQVGGKQCQLYVFSWTDIERLTFQVGSKDYIHTRAYMCSHKPAYCCHFLYPCFWIVLYLSLALQGSRFEIAAVGSLCLPKLVYYTPSATHSKHILRHLSDSHRFHIITRDAVGYIQQLEDMQASHFYKEAYICDTTRLAHRLQSNRLTSSISDCSVAVETTTAWSKEEEEEEDITEFELCVDEPEELFVDSPAELSWLAELSVDGPLVLPSSYWAAVTMEMKQVSRSLTEHFQISPTSKVSVFFSLIFVQVLKSRADDEGVSMD
ncbi:FERM domain-containing protein 6-like isoform X2 [Perca fluviatilis]|uniref:FERM domain-containing protein 6-like isoform X2 n=1 Tax=Perca fluviatilis TaxID=8168 RepID=UPI001962B801|nr:FERM domain-containing protein 6-like isoform X2 [Perca fluviatilis]